MAFVRTHSNNCILKKRGLRVREEMDWPRSHTRPPASGAPRPDWLIVLSPAGCPEVPQTFPSVTATFRASRLMCWASTFLHFSCFWLTKYYKSGSHPSLILTQCIFLFQIKKKRKGGNSLKKQILYMWIPQENDFPPFLSSNSPRAEILWSTSFTIY